MSRSMRSGFWRTCRVSFRWLRISIWSLVLLALLAFLWLNHVGLPNFLKTRLVIALHQRGVEIDFSRMRLRLNRGLVAENVRLGEIKNSGGATLTAREVQVGLDYRALRHGQLQIENLNVRDGDFKFPVSPTNSLFVTNLQTHLRFQTNGTWTLDNFHAHFAGMQISLAGEMAHAPEMRHWEIFQHKPPPLISTEKPTGLKDFADTLAKIHFAGEPQLDLNFRGDARDWHSFIAQLKIAAPGVRTPWFNARDLRLNSVFTTRANSMTNLNPALAWWTNLQPVQVAWAAQFADLKSKKLDMDKTTMVGSWRAPELNLGNFSAQLGGGKMDAAAQLNVATRELIFQNQSSFDPHALARFMTENLRAQFAKVFLTQPPFLRVEGSLRLPAWTNQPADWSMVESTAQVRGELAMTNFAVAKIPVDSVQAHFAFENLILNLPDFSISQKRTHLELAGEVSDATKNFRGRARGFFVVTNILSFVHSTNAEDEFSHFSFTEPLALDLNIAGNLRDVNQLSVTGRVALTNFVLRGQSADSIASGINYSNLIFDFSRPEILRAGGKQIMTAAKVQLDLAHKELFFTDGFSTIMPLTLVRCIGRRSAHLLEPYEFLTLPTARVNGQLSLRQTNGDLMVDDTDMRFDILSPVAFRWKKFETPQLRGSILWQGKFLTLTNMVGKVYDGDAQGWARFNVKTPGPGSDFEFFFAGTNVDFHTMGRALWSPKNKLEGALSGEVTVTHANSDDWQTWNGFGEAKLRDGLLWDTPVFGLFSPILNAFVPGSGNSRATQATAKFQMTNGVVATDSLEIRASLMRLRYAGTVDLQQRLDARATAQLLRDTWGIGPLFSAMLSPVTKALEFKVTGTLSDPKMAPLYFPSFFLAPLHPISTVKELFSAPNTNNTPAPKP
jgi:hypothetical protein